MKVYCPNCGQANETGPGGRVMCTACTAVFDAPPEAGAPPGELPPPPAPAAPPPEQSWSQPSAAPPDPYAAPQPQYAPPPAYAPQLPAQSWQPSVPSYGSPTSLGGAVPVTNTLAIISLVAGIVCCIPGISALTAIICGFIAIGQINASNGMQKGKGLAIAGIILGGLGILINVISIIGNIAQTMPQ